jgi:TolA-binding protein
MLTMVVCITAFLNVLLLNVPLAAQPLAWKSPDAARLLDEGQQELFNYDLPLAESKFDSLITLEPTRPEGYFFKSACYSWRYLLSEKESDYQNLLIHGDRSHEKTEAFIDANAASPKAAALGKYFLAEHHLHRGAAEARHKNSTSSAIQLHKAKGLFKDALALDNTLYDAAKGVGFVEFFSSLIPSSYRWLAAVFGYAGEREDGLKKLRLAREKSFYSRRESKYYLAMIDFIFYNQFEFAEKELLELAKDFPHSTAINYSLGTLYYKFRKNDAAKTYLTLAEADLNRNADNAFSMYALFRHGELLFRENDMENAKQKFTAYLRLADYSVYHAQCRYKLGLAFELTGKRDSAMRMYNGAATSLLDSPDEQYARRKCKEFLKQPLSDVAKVLLTARNAFDAGRPSDCLTALNALSPSSLTLDEQAEFHYRLAHAYHDTGNEEKAVEAYKTSIAIRAERERHFAPQSRVYLARLYIKQKKYALAADELDRASRYSGYDFETEVQREIKLETESLEKLTGK